MGKKAAYHLSNCGVKFRENATTENYLAFAAWIITGKMPNLGVLMDQEEANRRMKELDEIYARGEKPELAYCGLRYNKSQTIPFTKCRKVFVTNIETGEEKEFSSIKEASEWLSLIWDMKPISIGACLRYRTEYKGYKIKISGKRDKRKTSKPVLAKNVKTGESYKFESLSDCSRFLTELYGVIVGSGMIAEKAENGKFYKETWKFEYISKE